MENNVVQANTGHDNTEHALTTSLAHVCFFNTFCLLEEMKNKYIAIIHKQIIMKIIIIWWRESYKTAIKTLVEWFWRDLARVDSSHFEASMNPF